MSAVCDMWSFFIEIEIYRRYEVIIERERERSVGLLCNIGNFF